MRMFVAALLLLSAPDDTLQPWGSNHHASDAPKKHVEELTAGRHAYTVKQGGTMDGTNCRTPVSCGMSASNFADGSPARAGSISPGWHAAWRRRNSASSTCIFDFCSPSRAIRVNSVAR